jgi:3-deoxy-manno-octulosonate cytidylyltransferase (CMP-KDO synthetase)
MLEEVWRRSSKSSRIDALVVATDDGRIADAAQEFGAQVAMTSNTHVSGTDRAAEVLRSRSETYDVILVVQCDEPLLTGTCLDRLIACFDTDAPDMATLCEPLDDAEDLFNPNVVKVVTDDRGHALYFSRSPLPFYRGGETRLEADFRPALADRPGGLAGYRKHQGLYAYTRRTLLELTQMQPSSLERDEGLEQLRALQAGCNIRVIDSDFRSFSVDTPEDLKRVATMLTEAN